MTTFSVDPLKENSLMYLYAIRDEIDFNPIYQRQGDIWPASKKSLLIDSLLNGFDLPKIYFHDVSRRQAGKQTRFSVIDGKQRLEAIFSFLDGKFAVPTDFQDMAGVFGAFAGRRYEEFGKVSLKLKARFESLPLPVYVVKTTDTDLIEEMFSRLNEASPLNAAEKRNALGGPITDVIHELAEHEFFKSTLPFMNKRYKHYDVLAKLLLLAERGRVVDTKRIHLDKFIKSYSINDASEVLAMKARVFEILNVMHREFEKGERLLKLVTMVPIYFALVMVLLSRGQVIKFNRFLLLEFEDRKRKNRELAQSDEENSGVNYDWLEYDRLTQSPNDSSSIEFKINVLLNYLGETSIPNKVLY